MFCDGLFSTAFAVSFRECGAPEDQSFPDAVYLPSHLPKNFKPNVGT